MAHQVVEHSDVGRYDLSSLRNIGSGGGPTSPEIQERLRKVFPEAGENMGLVGTTYLFELAPGWWAGPALYGAASGHRGGLLTWGAEVQRRWSIAQRWELVGGLYAGGGGGVLLALDPSG